VASEYGQDLFVLDVLEGMRDGFFLDSGASNGVRASNTHRLETEFEWTGICVEPNEIIFAELVRNRRCCCINCALYNREGTVDFVEKAFVLGGILDEYHPEHLQHAIASFGVPEDAAGRPVTVSRPARTVRSVLRECAAPSVIDYWSLDTEGSELTILESFPFDEYSFRVLTVEHNCLPVRDQIRGFLERQGYRRIQVLEVDDCYMKQESLYRSPWQSHAWGRNAR
jgi:FkbM family methyltransferase